MFGDGNQDVLTALAKNSVGMEMSKNCIKCMVL